MFTVLKSFEPSNQSKPLLKQRWRTDEEFKSARARSWGWTLEDLGGIALYAFVFYGLQGHSFNGLSPDCQLSSQTARVTHLDWRDDSRRRTHVQGRGGEQHVGGLCDIGSVQAVVVGHVGMVVVLQRHHVGDERLHGDLERLEQIPLLQNNKNNKKQTSSVVVLLLTSEIFRKLLTLYNN